jgi:hypothetical protein
VSGQVNIYHGWGIELDDYDRRFLVGVGYSPYLTGKPADFGHVVRTLTFATRDEARSVLANYKAASEWSFVGKSVRAGGNRIYRSGRVVRLQITVEAV